MVCTGDTNDGGWLSGDCDINTVNPITTDSSDGTFAIFFDGSNL